MGQVAVLGSVIDHRYRLEDRIGAGGMGVVYRARQLNVGRDVALKVLPPTRSSDERAIEQFLTETQAISRLTSPHTVTLYDAGRVEENGAPFLAMELLEGRTLRSRLAEGPCELDEALRIIEGVALSLAEAHARGIVHRDVKPSNVFLAHTPRHAATVKVLDFGLARLGGEAPTRGHAAGTLLYMAPEQIRGEDVDPRADVYGLALLAYEVLAGRHPFADLDRAELIEAHLSEMPPPIDEVSPLALPRAATKLLASSLAKPARLRPEHAGVFRTRLCRAFGLPVATPAEATSASSSEDPATLPSQTMLSQTLPTPVRAETSRERFWLAGVGAVLVLAGSAYALRDRHEAQANATRVAVNTATEATASERATTTIRLESIPPGAIVRVDGEKRGVAPVDLVLAADATVDLALSREGYEDHIQELVPRRDSTIIVRLTKSTTVVEPTIDPAPVPASARPRSAAQPPSPQRPSPQSPAAQSPAAQPPAPTAAPRVVPNLRDRVDDYLGD